MSEVQQQGPVRVALIGSGRMGSFHGETLARRLPGAQLAAVADPAPGAAALRRRGHLSPDTSYEGSPVASACTGRESQ